MSQAYSNAARARDPMSLPDLELFCISTADGHFDPPLMPGWYYWFCLPGCLPDSDPVGPFETETAALNDARLN